MEQVRWTLSELRVVRASAKYWFCPSGRSPRLGARLPQLRWSPSSYILPIRDCGVDTGAMCL